jgi:3-hydroxy-3-methylglutaryl CoA synthase
LKNQLKKVAIGVDTTCFASDNSGSETNAQGAVAIFVPIDPDSVICHNHVSFSVEAVL